MIYKGSFEDILFVLAGVIWIGYSFLKAAKKNNTGDKKPKRPVNNSDLNTLFDELLSYNSPETKEQTTSVLEENVIDATQQENKESTYNSTIEHSFSYNNYVKEQETKNVTTQPSENNDESWVNKNSKSFTFSGNDKNFNLKKAFIYSEILKQKYI